jgi:hypothetical protein
VNYFRRLPNGDLTSEGVLYGPGGKPLDAGHNSAPVVCDWNEDGLPDLLLGRQEGPPGCVYLYLNEGSPGDPVLGDSILLESGGEPIIFYNACPHVYDLNQDGAKDLLLGECTGRVLYFENVGENDWPVFDGYEALQSAGSVIQDSWETRPAVDDWNEDGTPDLLVGEYWGLVFLYLACPTGFWEEPWMDPGVESAPALRVSPVPASGCAVIELTLPETFDSRLEVSILDLSGRVVRALRCGEDDAGGLVKFAVDGLPAGTYVVRASTQSTETDLTARMVILP